MENNINKDVQFNLSEVTDKSEYKKADMTRIVTLNNIVSLSFYQINYEGLSLAMEDPKNTNETINGSSHLNVVSKIVMDIEAFKNLKMMVYQIEFK